MIETSSNGLKIKNMIIICEVYIEHICFYWVQIELNDQPYAYQVTIVNKIFLLTLKRTVRDNHLSYSSFFK